jgi:DNA polymerase III epsilon subunit-like protein
MPPNSTRKGRVSNNKKPKSVSNITKKNTKVYKTSGKNLTSSMAALSLGLNAATTSNKLPLRKTAKEFVPSNAAAPVKKLALRANVKEYVPLSAPVVSSNTKNPINFTPLFPPVVAIDCEMVKVRDPTKSGLAEVAVVDWNGDVVYHKYVIPPSEVTNYLTRITGITKEKLEREGVPFDEVQKELEGILANKIIVGHALDNDIRAIGIPIPADRKWNSFDVPELMRTTPIKKESRRLKILTLGLLGYPIQDGAHSAVIDAQASMGIYRWYVSHTMFGMLPLSEEAVAQISHLDELERLNKLNRNKH